MKHEKMIKVLSVVFIVFIIFGIYMLIVYIFAPLALFQQLQNTPPDVENKYINFIDMKLDLNYTEVEKINATFSKIALTKLNYTFYSRDEMNFSDKYILYSIGYPNDNSVSLGIYANNTSKKAWLNVIMIDKVIPESEFAKEKEYIKEGVDDVAYACNLTIDWSNAKWSYSYAD